MNLERRGLLTERQLDVLNAIEEYIAANGYPPTVRELCEACHVASPATMHKHLQKLVAKGCLEIRAASSRALRVVS